jgi:hypothetical protein
MALRLARGLFRLWLVLSVLWIGGVETTNAQSYRRYGAARTYTPQPYPPQSRGSVRREGVLRTTPFSDPNSPEATGGGNIGYNRGLPDGGY